MDMDNHIFEQDIVVAAESFARRSGLPDPERSLMLAVLEDALRCFVNGGTAEGKARVLHDEARAWFESDAHDRLYDFANVCDVLGIDASWLRRQLFALHGQRRAPATAPSPAAPPDDTDTADAPDAWQHAG